jgi:hypothetical protein
MTILINLPQRFQAVDGATPFEAGIRLLPLLLSSPVATAIAGQLASKYKVPPFFLLLFATSLQILGIGLSSSVKFTSGKEMYGYEVIMGFGFGMGLVSLLIFTPLVVDRADMGTCPNKVPPLVKFLLLTFSKLFPWALSLRSEYSVGRSVWPSGE